MNSEQQERLSKLRARKDEAISAAIDNYEFRPLPTWGDIDFLLSLVDSLEARNNEELKSWQRVAERLEQEKAPDFYERYNLKLSQASEHAATSMRSACIEKVKELGRNWEHAAIQWHKKAEEDLRPEIRRIDYEERDACLLKRDAANVIANNLELVTIQEQEKQ